jgi:hypothetical protein
MRSQLRIALALLAILTSAALLNGFALPVAGRNMRPEHLASAVVFLAFLVWQLGRRTLIIRLDAVAVLTVGWVAVNGVSSWLFAPQPSESFVHVVRMALLGVTLLTVANLPFRDGEQWAAAVRLWVSLGVLALAYGLFAWLLAHYGEGGLPGVGREPFLSELSVRGTQLERNLYGILAATLLGVLAYVLVSLPSPHRPWLASRGALAAGCTIAAGALVLSQTRSAWLAVLSVGPLAYVLFDRRRLSRADRGLVQLTLVVPLLLGILIGVWQMLPAPAAVHSLPLPETNRSGMPPAVPTAPASALSDRVSTFGRLQSDFTLNTRVQDALWALDDWLASPWLGHGTGSFGQLHGTRKGTAAWISNLVLHTLVDTGVVGLAIQAALVGLVGWHAWRAGTRASDPSLSTGLRALTVGLLVMLVAYQVTDGTWMALFWIHLGLMVNGTRLARGTSQSGPIDAGEDARERGPDRLETEFS